MNMLDLFSGIGGISLAADWAGIKTKAFCEKNPFGQKILKKHWANIPIYDDVCTLTKERLDQDGIGTIDIISAGYPCQPFSTAGKREGESDDRFLWPEALRLIQEIRPRWFVGENVAGHVTLGLDGVLTDLDNEGYTSEAFLIPASAVYAPHRRYRIFIVSYSESERPEKTRGFRRDESKKWTPGSRKNVSNPPGIHAQGFDHRSWQEQPRGSSWWEVEPGMGRVVDGVPHWVDRLEGLGNAVVPQQIYPILAGIKRINDSLKVC